MGLLKRPARPDAAGFTSPERAALAAAIERRDAAAALAARLPPLPGMAFVRPGDDAVRRAEDAAEAARGNLEAARAAAVAQARGEAVSAPLTMREAREALFDAEDAVEVARAARDTMRQEESDAVDRLPLLRTLVSEAAKAVVAAEAAERAWRLVEQVERLQRQLVAAGSLLQAVVRAGVFPTQVGRGEHWPGDPLDERVRTVNGRLMSPPATWRGLDEAVLDLKGVLTALETDATAPVVLPRVGTA